MDGVISILSDGVEKDNGECLHKKSKVRQSILKLEYSNPHHEEWVEPVIFTNQELLDVDLKYNDPMVVTARIVNFMVEHILVDQGSSSDVLFKTCFNRLKLSPKDLKPHDQNLIGFTRDQISPLNKINIRMTLEKAPEPLAILKKDALIYVYLSATDDAISSALVFDEQEE